MSETTINTIPLGAILQTFKVKGVDIVHGFPTADLYKEHNSPYYGETIGRVANRIKNATIDNLNNTSYTLTANDTPNALHGGAVGWGKRVWEGPTPVELTEIPGINNLKNGETTRYNLVSEDGDEGYPGTVEVTVTYTKGTQTIAGKEIVVLGIEYEARLVGDIEETAVNITNHSYFNLSGEATIEGTEVSLITDKHLPVDDTGIPTGKPIVYPGLDTTKTFTLGATEPNIDTCFTPITNPAAVPLDTRTGPLRNNLTAFHAKTGIRLEVLSTEPSFQFYTGHFTDVPAIGDLPARGARSAFCCEPGRYINAVNVPEWRSMTVLKKGETYGSRIVYRVWSEQMFGKGKTGQKTA